MKPRVISAEALFEEHQPALRWEWIAGHAHPERRFDEAAVREARSAADLIGYLNYIHPYRVQLVGRREVAYLENADKEVQQRRIQRIVTLEPPVLIVADGERAPLTTRTARMPSLAAAAAVTRAWFDCTAPAVMSVSAPAACARAATSASFRTLFPPNANEIASSRLTKRRGPPPRIADRRGRGSTGVGRSANESDGMRASAAPSSANVTTCIV